MSNSLSNVMPKLLARGLMALREQAIMPRIINGDYSADAAQKGDTIDVPIPSIVPASDVTPSNTPPVPGDSAPTKVQIVLSNWKKSNFFLNDKELNDIDANKNYLPIQSSEAIRSLANAINASVLAEYKSVYGYVGTAGTTPFATDASAIINARKTLHAQLCPRADRRAVLNFDAE